MNEFLDPAIFAEEVNRIRASAERLKDMGTDFPAINRNAMRILASLRMIELNLEAADSLPE